MMEDVPLEDAELPVVSSVDCPRTERWRSQLGLGDRSIADDHARYAELSDRYAACFVMDDRSSSNNVNVNNNQDIQPPPPSAEPQLPDTGLLSTSIDPLTAMVQAEEARTAKETAIEHAYRTERARINRGMERAKIVDEEPDDVAANRQLISNDLVRLSPVFESSPERIEALARVLMVFAMEHSTMGYLQGMHEIASFVLYAIELDRGMDECDRHEREAECYALTEAILIKIAASYDTDPDNPLTQQSRRVLELTWQWPALYRRLRAAFCHIPSQLVFTKWMRLLFGREVATHSLVLTVWDAIFEIEGSLQTTIEALAAARLLQHGRHVLVELNDDDALLQWFMNIPPETTVEVWIRRMRVLLQLEPPFDAPPQLPPPRTVPGMNPAVDQQRQRVAYQQPGMNGASPTFAGHTNTSNSSPWDLSVASHLTNFTGKLAAQTQSISKLITQEWDSLQQQPQPQTAQRPMSVAPSAEKYNLDYYPRDHQRLGLPTSPADPTMGIANHPSASPGQRIIQPVGTDNSILSDRLQQSVLVMQQFAVHVEQQAGMRVPPNVWTALADLQGLQEELKTRPYSG